MSTDEGSGLSVRKSDGVPILCPRCREWIAVDRGDNGPLGGRHINTRTGIPKVLPRDPAAVDAFDALGFTQLPAALRVQALAYFVKCRRCKRPWWVAFDGTVHPAMDS